MEGCRLCLLTTSFAFVFSHASSSLIAPFFPLPTHTNPTQSTMTTNISKKRKFIADGVFYAELNEVRAREGLASRRGKGGERDGGEGGVDRAGGQQHTAAQGWAGPATAPLARRPVEAACGGGERWWGERVAGVEWGIDDGLPP